MSAPVGQVPISQQQQQLAALHAAQAAAYHNDQDPAKVGGPAAVVTDTGLHYEETHDPPSREMAYFHLLTHQFAIWLSFSMIALVIAFGSVWGDLKGLRDDVSNNLRLECKDLTDAILSYYSLVVIVGGFAVFTWASWFVKKWLRYLPVVSGIIFLAVTFALALYNVAGTVAFGKPTSSACYARSELDATLAYYMVEGALITIWVSIGLPVAVLGLYRFYAQVFDLAKEFPTDRELREAARAERELLMVPPNPARAFRYP